MENGLSSLMRLLYESHSQESGTVSRKSEKDVPAVRLDSQNTLNGLAGSSVVCPPVDAELLNVYFSYFIDSGLPPSPSDRTSEF